MMMSTQLPDLPFQLALCHGLLLVGVDECFEGVPVVLPLLVDMMSSAAIGTIIVFQG